MSPSNCNKFEFQALSSATSAGLVHDLNNLFKEGWQLVPNSLHFPANDNCMAIVYKPLPQELDPRIAQGYVSTRAQ